MVADPPGTLTPCSQSPLYFLPFPVYRPVFLPYTFDYGVTLPYHDSPRVTSRLLAPAMRCRRDCAHPGHVFPCDRSPACCSHLTPPAHGHSRSSRHFRLCYFPFYLWKHGILHLRPLFSFPFPFSYFLFLFPISSTFSYPNVRKERMEDYLWIFQTDVLFSFQLNFS